MIVPALTLTLAWLADQETQTTGLDRQLADLEAALREADQVTYGGRAAPAYVQAFLHLEPAHVPDRMLLGVLLAGSTARDPMAVADELLAGAQGDLQRVHRAGLIADVKGIGPVGRARLLAAQELYRRGAAREIAGNITRITGPEDSWRLVQTVLGYEQEALGAIYLDRKGRVLGTRRISLGNRSMTIVDPRDIFRHALDLGATTVVLAHNHPSGDPTPSQEDIEVTSRVYEAGKIIGIDLLDHIVSTAHSYMSLAALGYLPRVETMPMITRR